MVWNYFICGIRHIKKEKEIIKNHIAQGGGTVKDRSNKSIIHIFKKEFGGLDFYIIVGIIVLSHLGQIILIDGIFLRLFCNRDIALRPRVSNLYPDAQAKRCRIFEGGRHNRNFQ